MVLKRHAVVGDVRGKGLLIGVELVADKEARTPVTQASVQFVVDFCKARGVIVGRSAGGSRYGNTIVFSPPLIITRGECERLVETLGQAVAALESRGAV
jgi:adenosylmethionine-8-amino-7-oxononanoate aminotransferase